MDGLVGAAERFKHLDVSDRSMRAIQKIVLADESLNADAFVEVLTADAKFLYGSQPVVEGKEEIRSSVTRLFTTLESLHHDISEAFERGDWLYYVAQVEFKFKDGRGARFDYLNRLGFDGFLISYYRIYIDISPLFVGGVAGG